MMNMFKASTRGLDIEQFMQNEKSKAGYICVGKMESKTGNTLLMVMTINEISKLRKLVSKLLIIAKDPENHDDNVCG